MLALDILQVYDNTLDTDQTDVYHSANKIRPPFAAHGIAARTSMINIGSISWAGQVRMPLYQICLAGNICAAKVAEVRLAIEEGLAPQGKALGTDVGWDVAPGDFNPPEREAAVVLFFGGSDKSVRTFKGALDRGVPCLPIVSDLTNVSAEIPSELTALNCLGYDEAGPTRIASAAMEALGLLPKQRRVFVSYRRTESRDAAVQLFDVLSARLFDVFLDTHGVALGEEFQAVLWHRLCDCDVLVMLDTATYFESRWTATEFGRALAKGISVLRVA